MIFQEISSCHILGTCSPSASRNLSLQYGFEIIWQFGFNTSLKFSLFFSQCKLELRSKEFTYMLTIAVTNLLHEGNLMYSRLQEQDCMHFISPSNVCCYTRNVQKMHKFFSDFMVTWICPFFRAVFPLINLNLVYVNLEKKSFWGKP